MSGNITDVVNQILLNRKEKAPRVETQACKLKAMDDAVRTAMTAKALVPDVVAFEAIPFSTALDEIQKATEAVDKAEKRLARKSINIGIAGKARQGKSKMLQMLTGLSDDQIPTGDGSFCTAARSEITNINKPWARVHFLTETDFMTKRVQPAFTKGAAKNGELGLEPMPLSLTAFLESPLPKLANSTPSAVKFYSELRKLHEAFGANPSLRNLLGQPPKEVEMSSLRKYVTKDKGDTDFYVVDYVEIEAPFAVDLPLGMKVFDLPGLGEMTANIRETMLKSVTNDADVVMLLRKPKVDSEVWEEEDYNICDDLHDVYKDANVELKDWILLVLNRDSRKGHDNIKGIDGLKDSADVPRGLSPVVCDCGDEKDVRRLVVEHMHELIGHIACIDDIHIGRAEKAYKVAVSAVRKVADSFAAVIGPAIAASGGFDEKGLLEEFWGDLRAPFKVAVEKQLEGMQEKFKDELRSAFGTAYAKMKKIYEECETSPDKALPVEFPVFSKNKLFTILRGSRGTKENIDRAARNQFGAVVELLRTELAPCCERLRTTYLDNVVQSVTKGNAALRSLLRSVSEQEVSTPEALFRTLRDRLEEGGRPVGTITSALDNLLHFDVSYETQLLPYLFDEQEFIDKFDPYSPNSELGELEKLLNKDFPGDFENQANVLFNALKNYSLNWVAPLANSRSEGPCQEVSKGIMRVVKANYRNFIAMFVWGEETELEWEAYVKTNQSTLWPEAYEQAAAKSQQGRQLSDIVSQLRKAAS